MKFLKTLLCVLCVFASTSVYAEDYISISDFSIMPGETKTISVELTNTHSLTALEFYIKLPEGISVAKKSNGKLDFSKNNDRLSDTHSLKMEQQADGNYKVLVYSDELDVIEGTSGPIFTMKIQADTNMSSGSFQGKIINQKLETSDKDKFTPADRTFTVKVGADKQPQSLSLSSIPVMTYGDGAYTLPSSTNEGLSLTWRVANTNIATVSGNSLTIKGAGSTTVTASNSGNSTYSAFSKEFTLTVNKTTLTVRANDCSKTEGEANPTLTLYYSGFKYSDNENSLTTKPTATTTATANSPAGTYPITVSGGQSNNYNFNYVNGTLTVYPKGGGEGLPQALWCSGNTTLYFICDTKTYKAGDTYNGQTVTEVWSGTDITNTQEVSRPQPSNSLEWNNFPSWNTAVKESLSRVVFSNNFSKVKPANLNCWFYECKNLKTIEGLQYLNTSNVKSMFALFYFCTSLTSLNLSKFDTSNVTDMSWMFDACINLTSLNVNNFDTSNVTDMSGMFAQCYSITKLDLSHFDTSKVKYMRSMFWSPSIPDLISLDLSGWDTSNVTDMSWMFFGCSGLTSLDVRHFNTSKVTDMSLMFYRCSSLTSIDVSHFNTSNVMGMYGMFADCSSLTSLDVSNFDTSNVTDMSDMFLECSRLTSIDISKFDTSNVTNMSGMFYNCSSLASLDVSKFDTSNVTNMNRMFCGCSNLTTIYCDYAWSFSSSPNIFTGCTSLVGGEGMTYDASKTDVTYANPGPNGYFTKVPTGIENIENDEENAGLQDGILYDMSGRPVGDVSIQRIEDLHVQSGIYILNGKKIMVK